MANFCGKCGSPLVNDKCPVCDTDIEKTVALPKEETTTSATAEILSAPTTESVNAKLDKKIEKLKKKEENKAAKKAKKKAKWQALSKKQKTTRIILKIVAWLLVAIVLTTVTLSTLVYFDVVKIPFVNSALNKLGIKKEAHNTDHASPIAFSINDNTYYLQSWQIFNISDDDTPFDTATRLSIQSAAFADNAIYCRQVDDPNLYKLTFNNDGSINEDIWVKESTIKSAGLRVDDIPRTKAITNLTYLDGYFYFYYAKHVEFYVNEIGKTYRLGRISLDGKEVELLNDNIHTNSIATDGEWLYYFENAHDSSRRWNANNNIVGIYRTKGDCSKTELIYKMKTVKETREDYSYRCSNMNVYGNYLYFLNSAESDNKATLCRINLDNNKVETVINDDVANYTIDTKNNKVYYLKGEFISQDPYTLCEFDIDSKDSRELFITENDYVGARTADLLTVHNGYLYITDPYRGFDFGSSKDAPYAIGYRYNTEEDDLYALCAYRIYEESFDLETGHYDFYVVDSDIYWKKVDVTPDSVYSYHDIIK